jgi:putative tryptophan/tyrosine transport system substrate-binding protein
MRHLLLIIIALATLLPSLAQAYDILILQSRRDAGYEDVLKGFHAVNSASQRTVVLPDYAEVDVARIVREDRPRLILAVGDAALTATRTVRQIPVVSVLSLGIRNQKATHPNLSGIDMFAQPERYITLFQTMKIRRVGVIYNPAKCGWYLQQARQAAEQAGIKLVTREVSAARDTLAQLSSLAGKVDALWMLPDTTAVSRETVEAYFRFGQDQTVPVVSFAGSYLGLGAAAVVELDRSELGRQVAGMTAESLSGGRRAAKPQEYPRSTTYKINSGVMNRFSPAADVMKKLSHQ